MQQDDPSRLSAPRPGETANEHCRPGEVQRDPDRPEMWTVETGIRLLSRDPLPAPARVIPEDPP